MSGHCDCVALCAGCVFCCLECRVRLTVFYVCMCLCLFHAVLKMHNMCAQGGISAGLPHASGVMAACRWLLAGPLLWRMGA
jgi:hypothetical protein